LVLVWLGGHREPRVVGEQGHDARRVAPLDGGGEVADELPLACGVRQGCVFETAGRQAFVERRASPLERAFDRALAAVEHRGRLGCVQAERVAGGLGRLDHRRHLLWAALAVAKRVQTAIGRDPLQPDA